MRGTFKIVTVADIPVKLHWTFGLLLLWPAYVAYGTGFQLGLVAWLALFILALFFCVVLHEYGHALTARHYGVKTRDIILSPIGGVARLERLPEQPWQEFSIALAGPLVNVAICCVMAPYFLIYPFDSVWTIARQLLQGGSAPTLADLSLHFIPILFMINILLASFNLLPAFPMDGGRVFRALLSIRLGRRRATQLAAYVGQALAVGFMFHGFYQGVFLNIFIGLVVFFTAAQEYRVVRLESLLTENTVRELLRRQFTALRSEESLERAVEGLKQGVEKNFLVMNEAEKVIGVLHEEFLLEAIKQKDESAPVASYLSDRFEVIDPDTSLKTIFLKMQEQGYSILPVYEDDKLVGVIDVSMMNNFLRLQQKLIK